MALPGSFLPILGCGLLPLNFIVGFALAKQFTKRTTSTGRKAGYMCLLAVSQASLCAIGSAHFVLGVVFAFAGYRSLVPGITGGLASGKTTATSFLRKHGWDIIDADEIAKRVLKRGTLAFYQTVRTFGKSIIDAASGEISRPRLRQLVFQNAAKRRALNGITHPWIIANIIWQLFKLRFCLWRGRVIIDIPLLFETHLDIFCGPIAVVYVQDELQLARLVARDQECPEDTLRSMIKCQLPLHRKAALADIVLDNSSTKNHLFEQIKQHFPC